MSTRDHVQIRDARDDEYAAIRDLTLAAYAEYATVMTAPAWTSIRAGVSESGHDSPTSRT